MEYFFLKIMDASRHGMLKNETFLQEFPLSHLNLHRTRTSVEALFLVHKFQNEASLVSGIDPGFEFL